MPAANGRSSASAKRSESPAASQPSPPTAEGGYPLAGVSSLPDPDFHAYRQDLADAALAGRVIASHYAEPLPRHLTADAVFYRAPSEQSEPIGRLKAGDELWLLDDTRGWAWGYGGKERRVGYVRAEALGS